MKLKGNSGITLEKIKLSSAILFLVLIAVRFYQSFFLTDAATGFFTKNNLTVPFMFVLAVGAVIAVCILCYISNNLPMGDIKSRPNVLYIIAGVFFSFTLLYDGIEGIRLMMGPYISFAYMKEAVGGNLGLIAIVFAILGAIAILLSLLIHLKTGSLTGKLRIPMLFPVIWAFARTLEYFSVTVSYIKVSQLFLAIFASAFLMVFLFENARVITGTGRKDAVWFYFASGIIAAGLCFSAGLPSFVAAIAAPEKLVSYAPFELYTLGGGLYALASLFIRETEKEAVTENTDTVTEIE